MNGTQNRRTSWQLARLAECSDPDRHDGLGFAEWDASEGHKASAGARFLRDVETSTLEQIEYSGGWDDDDAHEIADGAVPVYTHTLWATFVDLGAYQEDPSELGSEPDDVTRSAGVCLYMIAERLARAIAAELEDDDTGEVA